MKHLRTFFFSFALLLFIFPILACSQEKFAEAKSEFGTSDLEQSRSDSGHGRRRDIRDHCQNSDRRFSA